MYMRIITGSAKGTKLKAPSGLDTRPTADRVKESVFNILGDIVVDARVLDIFAGTGNLGLEALSRGAGSATFIEKDRLAQKILAENLQILDKNESAGEGKLIRASVSGWLNSTTSQFELGEIAEIPTFDIIFADPPYYDPQFPTIERLSERLNEDGILILSQPKEIETFSAPKLEIIDEKLYSGAKIIYLRKK